MVKDPVELISLEEITTAIKKMKLEKASGLLEVSMEMINASGKVGIDVMMKLDELQESNGWKRYDKLQSI